MEPANSLLGKVTLSHIQSFCLIVIAVIVFLTTMNIVELIFVDFVHGNPYRPQSNAVSMMFLFPIFFSILAPIGVGLLFGVPQVLQVLVIIAVLKDVAGRDALPGWLRSQQ
jgi:hypothetical protein